MQVAPPPFLGVTLGRLVCAFAPARIVLFGSYAKGTACADSDVDLLVVADLEGDPVAHARRARQLTADSFPRVDVVLCRSGDLSESELTRSAFLLSVLGSGITVYSRG